MSGYLVKIEVFIPCDPRDPGEMATASALIAAMKTDQWRLHPHVDYSREIPKPEKIDFRWIARRKSPASSNTPSAEATQEQSGTAGPQSPAVPAADDQPIIPRFLDRSAK